MAYMSTEQAADIRARLKAEFPKEKGWKLGVRKSSGNLGIQVTFLEGPHTFRAWDFDKYSHDPDVPKSRQHAEAMGRVETVRRAQVNQYWIRDHWTDSSAEILERAMSVIARDHWDESDAMSDYFHCAYYIDLEIGAYGKPYVSWET